MIIDDIEMLKAFSRHFNSRITTSDFINNSSQMVAILNKTPESISAIWLPCDNERLYKQLVGSRYAELLYKLAQGIIIESQLRDIYLSDIDGTLFNIYIEYLEQAKRKITIKLNAENYQFQIIAPELFVDITISAFSQLHTELTAQFDIFNNLTAGLMSESGQSHPENLFINSKASTAFSSFILTYVGQSLNIKLHI
ncbi:hypothetical protein FFF34_014935 [Inquilinus sp. KBS0705]|nr:hypothetical protein FFF34_014935 [Inquilinus sp. KBS0705]